jgi:DNA repair exonuclease SbcCD nuclease subunit
MKVIAIGDPHFQTDNITEVNLFIQRIEELCIKEEPKLIIVLGDVLHTHERLHTSALNKAYEFIDKMRKIAPTFVLVGNHDYIQNMQFLTTNHWMNGMKEWNDVTIVDKVVYKEIEGIHLVFCPYVPPGRFKEALDTCDMKFEDVDCIFAHQEFFSCKMGAINSVDGDKWEENYPCVVSGHIHSKQSIGNNIYYCGSAMQHAFGESEENIIPILEWNRHGEKYILREENLGLPRKKIIYTDIEKIEDVKEIKTNDKVKMSITGNYDEFKAFKKTKKYKDLVQSGVKVVFKTKKTENSIQTTETDFHKILHSLVLGEQNTTLYRLFEQVVNNKIINEDDIFIASNK